MWVETIPIISASNGIQQICGVDEEQRVRKDERDF